MRGPVSIIIPAFNQLQYCQQCIASVQASTRGDYKLILVDNGSSDGVGEYFDSIPGAVVLHADRNRGFAGGVNLGLDRAEGHVVLLNSDALVPDGWLDRLEAALRSADDIGMAGPMSNNVSGAQMIEGLEFASLDGINAYARGLAARNAGKLRDTNRLVGFCVMIRDTALKAAGRFDERFGPGNFEDDDYGLRVMRAGFRLCIAEDCFVFHYGSRTFVGMGLIGDNWTKLMEENKKRFAEKWSGLAPAAAAEKPPDMNVVIREYRPEDAEEWMRTHAIILSISHAWNYTIQERPVYERESTQLVAVADGKIAGLTDVEYDREVGDICFLKDSPGGYVLELGRLPEYQGLGIGKLLIAATVEDAKKKGFHRLEYWSQDRRAQRYYARLGMKEIGRHYRFRMKPTQEVTELIGKDYIAIEYLYGACLPEEWPLVKEKFEIIHKAPLEPHLCVGYEIRF